MAPITVLNHLIAVDYDAIEAYEAAIGRLGSTPDATQLVRFLDDHKRHVLDLTRLVKDLGGEATGHADFRRFVNTGRVVLGGLIGDDAVLHAMKSNEDDIGSHYERAASSEGLAIDARSLVLRIMGDERRHRDWFERRLDMRPKDPVIDQVLIRPA
jgi:hypothetical protein